MTCEELRTVFQAYVDRELPVGDMLAAEHHLTFCMACQWRYAVERDFRTALRQKAPRERAPAELEARVSRALRAVDRSRRLQTSVRWLSVPAAIAALALLLLARLKVPEPVLIAGAGAVGVLIFWMRG